MRTAIGRALPSLSTALFGAVLWAAAMGASALTVLLMDDWQTLASIRFLALLFAAGGALAFPFGLFFARLISAGRGSETAFAAAFLSLLICTVAITCGLYALQYRLYYAEWHAPTLSFVWFLEMVFTAVAAAAQFAVLGVRLYFPVGFVALFAAGIWFARQPR
ncbi:hypothetical protein [Mesorhizobium sp. A556]